MAVPPHADALLKFMKAVPDGTLLMHLPQDFPIALTKLLAAVASHLGEHSPPYFACSP